MEDFISFFLQGIANIFFSALGDKFSLRFKAASARRDEIRARGGGSPRSPRLTRRADLPGYVAPPGTIAEEWPAASVREDQAS